MFRDGGLQACNGEPHLSLISWQNTIELNGSTFALNRDKPRQSQRCRAAADTSHAAVFGTCFGRRSMRERSGIFLTEPYDPNKAIVLMVPGLQSTPFAFADLMKAMRRDPEVSAHFQVWTSCTARARRCCSTRSGCARNSKRRFATSIRTITISPQDISLFSDTAWAA